MARIKKPRRMLPAAQFLLIPLAVLFPIVGFGGEVELDRVRREYPAANERLQQFYRQIQGSCVLSKTSPGRPARNTRMKFAVQGDWIRVSMFGNSREKPPQPRQVDYCIGGEGALSVDRNPNKEGDAWTLRSAGRDDHLFERANFQSSLGLFLNFAFGRDEVDLKEVATRGTDGLRLAAVDPVMVDGRACLRLLLERADLTMGNHLAVTLDPEMGWAKRRVESFHKPGKVIRELEGTYDPGPGGMPLPLSVRVREPNGTVEVMTFESFSFDSTPAEAFTLAHYGLPAVSGRAVVQQGRWPFWLAGIGVAGLALAYSVRRMARAREARPAVA